MDKETNAKLMGIAEDVLNAPNCPLFKSKDTIFDSYNGQIASFGVSILTIGLKPTISVYYQDAPKQEGHNNEAYRRCILDVIAKMLTQYRSDEYHFSNAADLCRAVIEVDSKVKASDVINCSIALKEIVRTYNLG